MKDIRTYLANYTAASSGYSLGKLKDNPGDDTGSALTADLFNDLLYAFYAFINKYGTVSDTDESESASDFVDAVEAGCVMKDDGVQVMAASLELRKSDSTGIGINFTNSSTGTGSANGLFVGIDSNEVALISQLEAIMLQLRTNGAERLRLDASTPRITVANNARDLVDSSGYVVADKIRSTGLIDGVTWTSAQLLGSGLSISGIGSPALCALNGTDVAFIDETLDELRCYRFNGSTWALVGSGLSISGPSTPALCALNGTDVAFIDSILDQLRCYRFGFSIMGKPYHP